MDTWTKRGAETIADRITAYWRARGYKVTCTIVEVPFTVPMKSGRWDVRSDMVNGLPKDYRHDHD